MHVKQQKKFLACLFAPGLVFLTGCLQFINPVDMPAPGEVRQSLDLPNAVKNRVYIWFVHGLDPLDASNFSGLHDYVRKLGYIKTYYGQPYHSLHFEKEVRKIRAQDPGARIVLVGFSYGGGLVRDMACSLLEAKIDVDLLVYLDGVEFEGRPLFRPTNVRRVINVLSFARPEERKITEAENYRYTDVWHFATVTHPTTLRLMANELALVARRVPVIENEPLPMPEEPGSPHVLPPMPAVVISGKKDEWDFLKPDGYSVGYPGAKPIVDAGACPPGTPQP